MSKNIHIENINIKLSGSTAARARNLGNGLGDEVLKQVAGNSQQKRGVARIENLNAGKIKLTHSVSETALRGQIARKIADLIMERMK
jgi:hypothetical protein